MVVYPKMPTRAQIEEALKAYEAHPLTEEESKAQFIKAMMDEQAAAMKHPNWPWK